MALLQFRTVQDVLWSLFCGEDWRDCAGPCHSPQAVPHFPRMWSVSFGCCRVPSSFKGRGKLCSLVKVNSSGQGSHSVSIPLHASISSSTVLFTSFHMWYGIAWLKLGMIAQIGGWSSTPYSNRDSYVHS